MGLLLVENTEKGPTVWGEHVWAPMGDQNGDDVLRLPEEVLEDPGFLKALAGGSIAVIDPSPEIAERMAALHIGDKSATRRERAAGAQAAVMQTIDRRHDRDMIATSCIGPGPRGASGGCITQVIRRNDDPDTGPPLCGTHKHLARLFILIEPPGQPAVWTQVSSQ